MLEPLQAPIIARSLVPVILSGGAGARLWPLSRELHPKPFIRLSDGQSLLQKAFLRGAQLENVLEVLTVTNREFFFKTEDDYCEVNSQGIPTTFILEPMARNTAAAIALAAFDIAARHGEETLLLVLPADHLVQNQTAFQQAVFQAMQLAIDSKLVTFGIKPLHPETGYGYIEADGHKVRQFIEKPCLEKAIKYFASGCHFWNAGMFCFSAKTLLSAMQASAPDILQTTQLAWTKARLASGEYFRQVEIAPADFAAVREDSLDYAVLEKSPDVAVVPCDIGWSDVGSWNALAELHAADAQGNRVQGDVVLQDTTGCTIQSADRLVGLVGLKDLVIVDTPDALLVADKTKTQQVKQLYTHLKQHNHTAHKLHRTVYRPWGTYTIIEETAHFKIKRIEVKPGASLSLQLHRHRSEHWVVVSGMAEIVNGDYQTIIHPNESTFIPKGEKHRLSNPGQIPCILIEVQTGDYLGEDDIVRFEDCYGRVTGVS